MNALYCAVLDKNFLARGLALYQSLVEVNQRARFVFFCIDNFTATVLQELSLERAIIFRHDEFATTDLLAVKNSRTIAEYCWTCKPFILLHTIKNILDCEWAIYVDTDMMFFADPDSALPVDGSHYLLTPHRFQESMEHYERSVGKFNAGYVAVKSSVEGVQVLVWWSQQCISSCSAIAGDSRYADQKYLDQFPIFFPFGSISANKGLNTAPWNINNYFISNNKGVISVDEDILLLYHFQGLQLFDNATASLYIGDIRIHYVLKVSIYEPHLLALMRAFAKIRVIDSAFASGLGRQRKYLGNIVKRAFKRLMNSDNVVPFKVT